MNEVINSIQSDNTDNKTICNNSSKHDRNAVLDYIREHQPITQYQLAKQLGINRTSIYQMCKQFEFCGLIKFRVEIGENNRTHKLMIIPREDEE